MKDNLIAVLKAGYAINMSGDLACIPTLDGFYIVEYFLNSQIIKLKNLSPQQIKLIEDEDEYSEIFDNAEEAVDFFLHISPDAEVDANVEPKSLMGTLIKNDKDSYF